jgi:hypothetical protein
VAALPLNVMEKRREGSTTADERIKVFNATDPKLHFNTNEIIISILNHYRYQIVKHTEAKITNRNPNRIPEKSRVGPGGNVVICLLRSYFVFSA